MIKADEDSVSLCELLDRVLNKGAVLTGELIVSVANIELLYIGLSLLISSIETLIDAMDFHPEYLLETDTIIGTEPDRCGMMK